MNQPPAVPSSEPEPPRLSTVQKDLLLAEYESLRVEILKLIELQSQYLAVTVVAFGTIASLSFQVKNPRLLLIHPIIALILGVLWMNNAHSICRCAKYLRRIEDLFAVRELGGWEHFVSAHHHRASWIGFWGVRAMFGVSAVLALLLSLSIGPPRGVGWLLLGASIAITAAIGALSLWWRERSGDDQGPVAPVAS